MIALLFEMISVHCEKTSTVGGGNIATENINS